MAGTTLVAQAQGHDSLHLLLDGWASRALLYPNGGRQLFGLLSPGDAVDLDTLYGAVPDYGISAFTDCRFALVSRSEVRTAIQTDPELAMAVLRATLVEAQRAIRLNLAFACQPARIRVARLICELAKRYLIGREGQPDSRVAFTMPLTQAEVGNLLGLSAVHVNRVMQELHRNGLTRQSSKRLEILNWTGLVEAAA